MQILSNIIQGGPKMAQCFGMP